MLRPRAGLRAHGSSIGMESMITDQGQGASPDRMERFVVDKNARMDRTGSAPNLMIRQEHHVQLTVYERGVCAKAPHGLTDPSTRPGRQRPPKGEPYMGTEALSRRSGASPRRLEAQASEKARGIAETGHKLRSSHVTRPTKRTGHEAALSPHELTAARISWSPRRRSSLVLASVPHSRCSPGCALPGLGHVAESSRCRSLPARDTS